MSQEVETPTAAQTPSSAEVNPGNDNARIYTLTVWGLYAASLLTGVTGLAGFILALLKRGDVEGTPYASHMTKAIQVFVIGFVLAIVGALLTFVGIGFIVLIAVSIWFLVVTIKGIIRAVDGRPYHDA